MGKLNIPEQFRAGLLNLAALDSVTVSALVDALRNLSPSLSTKALSSSVSKSTSLPKRDDWHELLAALKALYTVRSDSGKSVTVFLDDLLKALKELDPKKLGKGKNADVKEKLESLLTIRSLVVSSNRKSLSSNDERVCCQTQVLTDLRPVFSDNPKDGPDGFLVTHRLRVGFHESRGTHQDFYVSLSPDDLVELKNSIEEAEEKSKSLQSMFGQPTSGRIN